VGVQQNGAALRRRAWRHSRWFYGHGSGPKVGRSAVSLAEQKLSTLECRPGSRFELPDRRDRDTKRAQDVLFRAR
jgi:hypothetical protein